MRDVIAATLIFAGITGTPVAEARLGQEPRAFVGDPRIKQYRYSPEQVFVVDASLGYLTTILLHADEVIEHLSVGDNFSWHAARLERGNAILVKPHYEDVETNMSVITDRGRVYTFQLVSGHVKPGSRAANYQLRFSYPEDAVQSFTAPPRAPAAATSGVTYEVAGEADFAPVRVWDDGIHTFFELPPQARRPALYTADARGRETLVNTTQQGDVIQAHSRSALWTLRVGDEAICVRDEDAPRPWQRRSPRLTRTDSDNGRD